MRRDVLKQFGIDSLDDLANKAGGVWTHLTERWFSVRLKNDDNATRRTVHPWWLAVQSLAAILGSEILIERRRKPDSIAVASWYVSHAAGCLAGYAARMKLPDIKRARDAFAADILAYWLGKDFDERYRVNRLKLNFDDSEGGEA